MQDSERRIKWGILGTAKIALEKVIPALQASRFCTVEAIASRDLGKAERAAAQTQVQRAFGSYQELLDYSGVDAIYNPLPNHLHVPWSLRALEAGKHVLCEKPLALSAQEAQLLADASADQPRLKVMEAFMYRFHPQWVEARQLVREGRIGPLQTIDSFFSYFNADPKNIRNQPQMGGGGLMDIGCYCVSLARFLVESEPVRALGVLQEDPRFGVDTLAWGLLDFGEVKSTFTSGTLLQAYQRVQIVGVRGRIAIEIPFNAPPDKPCRIWLQAGDEQRWLSFPVIDQYTIQGDLFARSILDDTLVPTPLSDAVANMRVIEAIQESHRLSRWVSLSVPGQPLSA